MREFMVLLRTNTFMQPIGLATIPAVGDAVQAGSRRFRVTAVTHLGVGKRWDPVAEILAEEIAPPRQPEPEPEEEAPKPNRAQRRSSKKKGTDGTA